MKSKMKQLAQYWPIISMFAGREKLVNLAMDEVHTARAVELSGGRVFGDSRDGVTNTIFCTHISSVAGRYEDLVTMSPVSRITTENIKGIFMKVLKGLTEIGFTVVSVTTDGHHMNQSFHNSLGDDGRHPEYIRNLYSSDTDARVYTMYDTVHLFKNMYFNLLNKKTLLCPPMSDSESPLHVQFGHLVQVYDMEHGTEAKMAFKLTDKVLYPTNVERVNVQLAVSAMHESTISALNYYAQKEEFSAFKDTAKFLQIVRKWFDIVNVKSVSVHIRLNDSNRKPVSKQEKEGLQYLERFQMMMCKWLGQKEKEFKMSKDTLQAVIYTCRGLVGLANYLLDKHGDVLEYILLGKVQSDKIEGHFGHLRKLAGGNYWASVRQFMEGEAVIRAKSLIKLSGYSLGAVTTEMKEAREQRQLDDSIVIQDLLDAAVNAENVDWDEGTEQAIIHLAGYLAHSVLNVHKCGSCQDLLVNKTSHHEANFRILLNEEDMELHGQDVAIAVKSFTDLLNRGRLLCPSQLAVSLTKDVCHIYRWLWKEKVTRYALISCTKPKEAFQRVIVSLGEEDDQLATLSCANNHNFLNVYFTMAGALFNAFTSNYSKDKNSEIHSKRKTSASMSRNQNEDKRKKLTGYK